MTKDPFTTIEFRVDGEVVEGIEHPVVPEIGSTIEFGATHDDDGDRLDPGLSGFDEYYHGDYQTVLEGEVVDVTYHYARAYARAECTVMVDLETADTVVTIVRIEPDWVMLFVDDECVRENHTISMEDALSLVDDVDYDRIESYTIADVEGLDGVDDLPEIPPYLKKYGVGVLDE